MNTAGGNQVIGFITAGAAAICIVLASLMRPFFVRPAQAAASRVQYNAAIYRDQLLTLDQDFTQGKLGQLDYDQARTELQRRLLEDSRNEDAPSTFQAARKTMIGVGLALPILACSFYLLIGNPGALQPAAAGHEQMANARDLEKMMATLAAKLESDPMNYAGWSMLARSYQAMGRSAEAEKAFERAGSFIDSDAEMLASYADVSAANAGGSFAGKPTELIEKALKADPQNGLALWLSGTADLEAKNYAKAILTWQKLAALLPPDTDNARMLQGAIDDVRAKSGLVPVRQ